MSARRRASWVEEEGRVAERARIGFHKGLVTGLAGMALAGLTRGKVTMPGEPLPPQDHTPPYSDYYRNKISPEEVSRMRQEALAKGVSVHDALMQRAGWPDIEFDGKLLVSHQDALLMGGKVQAPPGYADHVVFLYPNLCETCGTRICVEICSGEAITASAGRPAAVRPREVRTLRRLCVELLRDASRRPGEDKHRVPGRGGRSPFDGELTPPGHPGRLIGAAALPGEALLCYDPGEKVCLISE